MVGRFNGAFQNAPTTRLSYWLRRFLMLFGFVAMIFFVVFGSLAAARSGNVVQVIVLVALGVASVPTFVFIAGGEQRAVNASWKVAHESGADPVYVFARGWRIVDGREQSLSSGWIGVRERQLMISIGVGEDASHLSLSLGENLVVRRRTVLNGLAYSQLEVSASGFDARFELVNDKRPFFSFLADSDIDDVALAFGAAATRE